MRNGKKIFVSLALGALLATSASAMNHGMNGQGQGDCSSKDCNMSKGKGHKMNKGDCSKRDCNMKMGKNHGNGAGVIALVRHLNLSDEQREKIQGIMQDKRDDRKSPYSAFTKNGFDKKAYIQSMEDKRDDNIQRRADTIEKVYNILDSKQKEQLRVLMDIQDNR